MRVAKGWAVASFLDPALGAPRLLQAQGFGVGDSGSWWPGAWLLGPLRAGANQVFREIAFWGCAWIPSEVS